MDRITTTALLNIAASFDNEVSDELEVHTVKIELNGRHGGADVTIIASTPSMDNYEKTWEVD